MKLYTVEVYNLRMCMKGDNPGPKKFKGGNLKEIRSSGRWGYATVIWLKETFICVEILGEKHKNHLALIQDPHFPLVFMFVCKSWFWVEDIYLKPIIRQYGVIIHH